MKYSTSPKALALVHKFFPNVTRVRDARRGLRLEVLPRDVEPGGRRKHTACAFALACKRQLHVDGAIISVARAYLVKKDVALRYHVPTAIGREITAFDRGGAVAPGVYRLVKITKRLRLGPKKAKTGPKLKSRAPARHFTENIRVFQQGK